MRFSNTLRCDILFQFRHGFYYAYLFVTIVYILALLNLPESFRPLVTIFLLFTDTTILGFVFIGGIVLLEKGQNILESLFVTPLRLHEYFLSKLLSLTLLSLLSSLTIVLSTHGLFRHLALFTAGLALSSCFFTLLGFILVVRAKHVNDYFAKALGVGILVCPPLLGLLSITNSPLLYIFPSQATLLLLRIAFEDVAAFELIYAFGWLIACSLIAGIWAYRSFYKHIILKI